MHTYPIVKPNNKLIIITENINICKAEQKLHPSRSMELSELIRVRQLETKNLYPVQSKTDSA